jgi:hypothetical protein
LFHNFDSDLVVRGDEGSFIERQKNVGATLVVAHGQGQALPLQCLINQTVTKTKNLFRRLKWI